MLYDCVSKCSSRDRIRENSLYNYHQWCPSQSMIKVVRLWILFAQSTNVICTYLSEAMAELIIIKLSHYSAPCTGGKEIILLCDRVAKDDIQVRFFQESSGQGLVWEAYADFLPNDVHKQVAISLRTPKYFDESISQPVTVQIQLRRPSDGCVSQSRNFQLTPGELDPDGLVRKRHKRIKEENYDLLQEYIQLANTSFAAPTATESSSVISQPASVSPSQVPIPIKQLSSSPSSTRSPFVAPSFHQTPKHVSIANSWKDFSFGLWSLGIYIWIQDGGSNSRHFTASLSTVFSH